MGCGNFLCAENWDRQLNQHCHFDDVGGEIRFYLARDLSFVEMTGKRNCHFDDAGGEIWFNSVKDLSFVCQGHRYAGDDRPIEAVIPTKVGISA